MMDNKMKMRVIEELLNHLSDSRAGDLKSLMDKQKSAGVGIEPEGDEDPKGLKIESVEVMGKPLGEDMDELAENDMSKSPTIDPEKAKQMQKGATESGFQPDKWKKNLKEGLGLSQNDPSLMKDEDEMDDDEL